jgi:hypothetical protein
VVLIHSHSVIFIVLDRIYHALYNATHTYKAPDSFVHLRFRDYSPLTHEEAEKIEYEYRNDTWENLLFTNIVLFKTVSNSLSDSWKFATTNYSATTNEKHEENWAKYIKKMFEDAGMEKAYERVLIQSPLLFEELKTLFDKAVCEQGPGGNEPHGRLIVISMPKELAAKAVYLADQYGRRGFYLINKRLQNPSIEKFFPDPTSPRTTPAEVKENNDLAINSEWGLHLTQEFINPKDAQEAGVTIVGFDPAAHYRTSNYLLFEKKLNEVIEEIKKIHEKIT